MKADKNVYLLFLKNKRCRPCDGALINKAVRVLIATYLSIISILDDHIY